MDGDKLAENLNYMLLSWETRYWRNNFEQRKSSLNNELILCRNNEEIDDDLISPIINGYIREIEDEIERSNKEKELKLREQMELEKKKKEEEDKRKHEIELENKRKEDEKRLLEQKEALETKQIETKNKDIELKVPLENANKIMEHKIEGNNLIEKIRSYQDSNEYKEIISSIDSTMKSTRINIKKTIQLSINQISSTRQQIMLSSQRIKDLLSNLKTSSLPLYNYGLFLTANLFIDQCSGQICAFPDSAWSYSYTCVNILETNNDFEYFLEGLLFKECGLLFTSDFDDIVNSNNESEESFIKRISSIVRFYLCINILRGKFGKLWIWLVRILNKDKPHKFFASVMITVIQIVSYFFNSTFKNQFRKILDYIINFKLPRIYELIEGNQLLIKGHCKHLEGLLNDLKMSSNNIPPPNGFILKDKHVDVDC